MQNDRPQSNEDKKTGESTPQRLTYDEVVELSYINDEGVLMRPSIDSPSLPDGSVNYVLWPEPSNEPIPCEVIMHGDPTPDDAFVLASTLHPEHFSHYTEFKRFLEKHPEIRTRKPSQQRLLIHAGDWNRHWYQQEQRENEVLDKMNTDDLIDGIEQRKKEVQANKKQIQANNRNL